MTGVRLPRRAAWLTLAVALAGGTLAFLLVAPRPTDPLPTSIGERVAVPWHTSTRLTVVELKWVAADTAEIVTRRDSKTGTTFTHRLIDCGTGEFALLGEGTSEAEARADRPEKQARSPIMENSIPLYVAAWTCCRDGRAACRTDWTRR